MVLLYPLIKALHEFAHAFTTKIWGGVVRVMGVMLLVFFPMPYVDSSAANRFSSRHPHLHVLFVHSDQTLGMRLLQQMQRIWLTISG